MPPLVNLQTPTLSFVDSENKQQLVSDDSVVQIVSSKDAEFGGVAVSTLRSDADTVLDRTQKISSDGTSTFITGDLVCDSDIKLSGNLFNVDAEVSVSDHVEINSDGGSVPALKVTNVNNQAPPLLIQHGGSDIRSLAIDGTSQSWPGWLTGHSTLALTQATHIISNDSNRTFIKVCTFFNKEIQDLC